MIVLSLFDGMSCGQQALCRRQVKVDQYYASEIDKHAIKVTMANFPSTIQLGSVIGVDVFKLPKIDILLGGSPCQSFSFAGKRKGMTTKDEIQILTLNHYLELKSDGYQFEGQSYLFWEYMRILTDIQKVNPDVKFLLENVMMGEKWEKILTRAIGVKPIEINSALVSAQNRRRLYWTNIGQEPSGLFGDLDSIIKQPSDRGILLKDVLESEVSQKYFLKEETVKNLLEWEKRNKENGNGFKVEFKTADSKSAVLSTGSMKSSSTFLKIGKDGKVKANQDKASCFTAGANSGGNHSDMDLICVASRGRNPENPKSREVGINTEQQLEPRFDGKTNCLTSVQKDNLIIQLNPSTESNGKQHYQQNRIYDPQGITPALCSNKSDLLITNFDSLNDRQLANHKTEYEKANTFLSTSFKGSQANGMTLVGNTRIRRLTPVECERLQTVDDNYTAFVSDTQRYKMLGNGWTIEVISHIFSYLPKEFFTA